MPSAPRPALTPADFGALSIAIRAVHGRMRDRVVAACEAEALEQLAAEAAEEGGDTIYTIDRVAEAELLASFAPLAARWPMVLVAEGLGPTGRTTLPAGLDPADAVIRVIVDPIDGTRGLMYQKRPAFILTGVAPNSGEATALRDIVVAVQTEIPLVKQHLTDTLWVAPGADGAPVLGGERLDRMTGVRQPLRPRPSRATTIAGGFGALVRFFPGGRALSAAVDDALVEAALGVTPSGKALAFEDQYISSAGQLYELLMGHDRWVADLRPVFEPTLRAQGRARGLCAHPYDLCTTAIATAAGLLVTDPVGRPLDAPLDVTTDVAWLGFANAALRDQVMPALRTALQAAGITG